MQDFTKGSVLKQVIGFSSLLIISNLLLSGYNIINTAWVGRLLGHEAVAAIAAAGPIIMLFASFLMGLGAATTILVAQSYGDKNEALMKKVMANSFTTSMSFCLFLSAAAYSLRYPLLRAINTPPEIVHMSAAYLGVVMGAMVFQFFYNWLSGMLRGMGDAKTPLYIMIVSTVLNIILVPMFIIGVGFIPKLGVTGAAWGLVCANAIAGIGGYIFIARKYPVFHFNNLDFKYDFSIIKQVLIIGIPSSLQMIVTSLSGVFIIALVNRFGTKVTAACGIAMQVDMLSMFPAMSIGFAVTAMVGQNLGANNVRRVKKIMTKSLLFSLSIASLFTAVVFLFPKAIGSLFLSPDTADTQEVLSHLVMYYRYVSWSYVVYAVLFSIQAVVRGAGDTIPLLVIAFISLIVIRIPVAYFLSEHTVMKESGIWLAMLVSVILGAILSYGYYRTGKWEKVKVLRKIGERELAAGN